MNKLSVIAKGTLLAKIKLLEAEIEKMLENDNPVEGVYALYGDHPGEENLRSNRKNTKECKVKLTSVKHSLATNEQSKST